MNYPQENIKPYNAEERKSVQVERMFDHIAPAYDGLNHALSLGIDRIWRRKAIRWLKQFRPRRIMDIATGTGDFAILACKMLHPNMLVGIDISAGMMQIGKEKARKAGLDEKITFAKEDCSALSFQDGCFDAATVAFGIRNFEDLDKALSEIHRVLAPHGVLAILELSTPERFPMKQLYAPLFPLHHSGNRTDILQRQPRLPLPARLHKSVSPRRTHARHHPKSRIQDCRVQTAHFRHLHFLYGKEITKQNSLQSWTNTV